MWSKAVCRTLGLARAQFAGVAPSLAWQQAAAALGFGGVERFGDGAFARFETREAKALAHI